MRPRRQVTPARKLLISVPCIRAIKSRGSCGTILALNWRKRRNYSIHYLVEPVRLRVSSTSRNCSIFSRSYSIRSGCVSKILSDESYSVLQSSGLQHWYKNWQALRRNKLTASTFGGAVGFWPRRRVQLWLEKIGAIEPFIGNLATCWSNIKEEEAVERYKLITGNTVLFSGFQVYSEQKVEDNWLAASPDGIVDIVFYELPSRGVLEVKCPFFDGDVSKVSPWKRIPLYCIPQAQGLLEIMDRDWMDFYVWTVKGSSLFRVHRDVRYWSVLQEALSDFWWKHVEPARELCNRYALSDPLTQLSSLRPAPKHELCSFLVCESRRVADNSHLLVREINGRLQN